MNSVLNIPTFVQASTNAKRQNRKDISNIKTSFDNGDIYPHNQPMEMPKLIPVGKHDFAIVDADMYDQLIKHRWHRSARSYASCYIKGNQVAMHRLVINAKKGESVDHINHSGLDNRRSNLRICTSSQNSANARKQLLAKANRITSSRYKGVSFRTDRKRWTAYIGTGTDRDCLGCFATEEEAALAYNKAAIARYGEFAKINSIGGDSSEY